MCNRREQQFVSDACWKPDDRLNGTGDPRVPAERSLMRTAAFHAAGFVMLRWRRHRLQHKLPG